ncbi:hypothetical protein ACFIJ5_10600 [Haloimpatiens sp. FM7330]|uniref:hypothetical protein n=1 Tax=Haloimpatiens sp. FM7330 TaxID=3298610 RepID=UPI00363250FE
MSNNNIELMKKIIEEKKKKSSQQGSTNRVVNKKIGEYKKAFRNTKQGGLFDK